jgi:hypothetical protein
MLTPLLLRRQSCHSVPTHNTHHHHPTDAAAETAGMCHSGWNGCCQQCAGAGTMPGAVATLNRGSPHTQPGGPGSGGIHQGQGLLLLQCAAPGWLRLMGWQQ